MSLLTLPEDALRHHLLPLLELKGTVLLDTAICSKAARVAYRTMLSGHSPDKSFGTKLKQKLEWMHNRNMLHNHLSLSGEIDFDEMHRIRTVFRSLQTLEFYNSLSESFVQDLLDINALSTLEQISLLGSAGDQECILLTLLKGSSNLRKLSLRADMVWPDQARLTDGTLEALAMYCPRLQSLKITGHTMQFEDSVMARLFSFCRFLRSILLEGDQGPSTFELMGLHCKQLRKLDLFNNDTITDDNLLAVVKGCPLLQELALSNCSVLTSAGIATCGPYCTQLLDVSLYLHQLDIDEPLVEPFFQHATALINLAGSFPSDVVAQAAVHWRSVQFLDLFTTNIGDEDIASVARHCVELRVLRLMQTVRITDASMVALSTHSHKLESLELFLCELITDDGIVALAEGCHALKYIAITANDNLTYCSAVALARRCTDGFFCDMHRYDIYSAKLKVYNEHSTWCGEGIYFWRQKTKVV